MRLGVSASTSCVCVGSSEVVLTRHGLVSRLGVMRVGLPPQRPLSPGPTQPSKRLPRWQTAGCPAVHCTTVRIKAVTSKRSHLHPAARLSRELEPVQGRSSLRHVGQTTGYRYLVSRERRLGDRKCRRRTASPTRLKSITFTVKGSCDSDLTGNFPRRTILQCSRPRLLGRLNQWCSFIVVVDENEPD
jgi:hypothetical protein